VFEILLFVNHLREISISEVDIVTGQISGTYTAKVLLSKEDAEKRRILADATSSAASSLKSHACSVQDVAKLDTIYTALVTDNVGNQEKWLVSQRLGFHGEIDENLK